MLEAVNSWWLMRAKGELRATAAAFEAVLAMFIFLTRRGLWQL